MSGPSTRPSELPLGRLEAFSDGILAIAITLIVLELGVAEVLAPASSAAPSSNGRRTWPMLTSFLTIGAVWMTHSAIIGAACAVRPQSQCARLASDRTRMAIPAITAATIQK